MAITLEDLEFCWNALGLEPSAHFGCVPHRHDVIGASMKEEYLSHAGQDREMQRGTRQHAQPRCLWGLVIYELTPELACVTRANLEPVEINRCGDSEYELDAG